MLKESTACFECWNYFVSHQHRRKTANVDFPLIVKSSDHTASVNSHERLVTSPVYPPTGCDLQLHQPLGHDEVTVHWRSQSDVDAADRVDVAEDEQHRSGHRLQHLHDALKALAGHFAHVGGLISIQDVGQAQLPHVDGPLHQHLAEQEVLCRMTQRNLDLESKM